MSDVGHVRDAIVRAARHTLVRGESVDVGKVAAEAGVNRATVFRQVGKRDRLIAEALWHVTAEQSWPAALAKHPEGTQFRVAEVTTSYAQVLIDEPWFRAFLERDPQRALRIVTTDEFQIQARMVDLVSRLLDSEPPPRLALDQHTLAYLIVRIAESFIYSDLIAGEVPSASVIRATLISLLY